MISYLCSTIAFTLAADFAFSFNFYLFWSFFWLLHNWDRRKYAIGTASYLGYPSRPPLYNHVTTSDRPFSPEHTSRHSGKGKSPFSICLYFSVDRGISDFRFGNKQLKVWFIGFIQYVCRCTIFSRIFFMKFHRTDSRHLVPAPCHVFDRRGWYIRIMFWTELCGQTAVVCKWVAVFH